MSFVYEKKGKLFSFPLITRERNRTNIFCTYTEFVTDPQKRILHKHLVYERFDKIKDKLVIDLNRRTEEIYENKEISINLWHNVLERFKHKKIFPTIVELNNIHQLSNGIVFTVNGTSFMDCEFLSTYLTRPIAILGIYIKEILRPSINEFFKDLLIVDEQINRHQLAPWYNKYFKEMTSNPIRYIQFHMCTGTYSIQPDKMAPLNT